MPKIEEVKILTIDNVPHAVNTMSPQIQQLVAIFNEWQQDLADATTKQQQLTAAVQGLSAQINTTIQQEAADKAKTAVVATDDVATDVTPTSGE